MLCKIWGWHFILYHQLTVFSEKYHLFDLLKELLCISSKIISKTIWLKTFGPSEVRALCARADIVTYTIKILSDLPFLIPLCTFLFTAYPDVLLLSMYTYFNIKSIQRHNKYYCLFFVSILIRGYECLVESLLLIY